ncbi:hypothetical protein [Azohydromonas caseinilytica]|uniref:Uncharacterized protein n=1 Tax=Azohydromonas caseinilytica TaxID=2728836 RepID=A0A848FB51_9BURK|nr:hypothetical protein [Azohydromonas caseinilytica]NML17427.1 hypothetical protein [Azohydromonas caseinilytica]
MKGAWSTCLLVAALGLLLALLALLLGMRSAVRQDELFLFVWNTWHRFKSNDAQNPVRWNHFHQLTAYPGKIEIQRPAITEKTMVAFVFGQSDSANSGGERFEVPDERVVNYWGGKYHRAADPLLGATANRLLERQPADRRPVERHARAWFRALQDPARMPGPTGMTPRP